MSRNICLWSSPRNISTACMYAFAQRPDTLVFDEPLYAHYLVQSGAKHPGRDFILQTQENEGEKVVSNLLLNQHEKPIAFFKQMTHHLLNLDKNFLLQMVNIIFIRDPKQIITSYAMVIPNFTIDDIGICMQWELYNYLTENNHTPIVLDSGELLKDPEYILKRLCQRLEIPFYSEMLRWPAGKKTYDGVWEKYWYSNVHSTKGFEKQQAHERVMPEHLKPLHIEANKYYEKLMPYSIKANNETAL